MTGFLARVVEEVLETLQPIIAAASDPDARAMVLAALNADDPRLTEGGILGAFGDIGSGVSAISEVSGAANPSIAEIGTAMDGLRQLIEGIRKLGAIQASDYPELGADLVNLAVVEHIRRRSALAFQLAVMFGIIERRLLPEIKRGTEVIRPARAIDRLMIERLDELFADPVALLTRDLPADPFATTADADRTMDLLVGRCGGVLTALDISWSYGLQPGDAEQLGAIAADVAHALSLFVPESLVPDTEAALVIRLSPKDQDDLGVILSPFGTLDLKTQVGGWALETTLGAEIQALAFGGGAGFRSLAPSGAAGTRLLFTANRVTEEGVPAAIIGEADGTRLELGAPAFSARLDLGPGGTEVGFSAGTGASAFVLNPGSADGFLRSLLPAGGMHVDFDLGLEWSRNGGLTFKGTTGLDLRIRVGVSVGPVTLSDCHIKLAARDSELYGEASLSLSALLGPARAVIERIGIAARLTFAEEGGSLGAADLDFGFKPPAGLGLSIDAASVVGGGYLFFDPENGQYAGVLQLEIADTINVKAFGLLSTRLPDGARGYSLIVFITAEDFQPIQLGMGFKLMGIGGMLAINRTFNEAAMREGLRNNTLGTLLFPRDPVRNAPEILRNLATVFPVRPGSYLFGPMAKIGWATPTLIQMDLALILEFGSRRRLIVLGRISSILPSRDQDLVRLNMDAMGVFDFDVGTISLDAVLVDSRLLQKFVLTGSMAMRACVVPGPRAGFALSVGGMNPHFSPPATMPKLDRLTINLTSGDNPRFTCEAYFAVTSNTIQFGSRSTLYAGAYGFSIEGDVGFDVLVQLLPFHFLADFHASIQLKRGSRNLFKVKVAGALEGPRPLRVSAKASFEILWCDFSIRFDKTLIAGEKPAPPTAVDAQAELERALARPESWNADLPAARRHGVTMRRLPGNAPLALDPLGELTVRQTVLPLNTSRDMDVFGGAPLSGVRRFTITAATLDPGTLPVRPVRDLFAPAQFFELSDDDRLAGPSFEEMDSGVVFGSDRVAFDESDTQRVDAPLKYETIIVDQAGEEAPAQPYTLGVNRLRQHVRFASVAKAAVRNTGLARFRNAGAAEAVSLAPQRWVVASTADLNVLAPQSADGLPWGEARAALDQLRRAQAGGATRWQLVPAHEAGA